MKKNEPKAKKILAQFKAKFPELTVTDIYDSNDGTVVKAMKNPEEFKMGVPYYQLLPGNVVINANPYGRFDWFKKATSEDNHIYHNTDINYPTPSFVEKGAEIEWIE